MGNNLYYSSPCLRMTLKDRTDEEKNRALGSVVYEALLLGLGIQLYRERNRFLKLEFAQWTREGQIALELSLIRCRSLVEFLSGHSKRNDDIKINQIEPVYKRSKSYVDSVNLVLLQPSTSDAPTSLGREQLQAWKHSRK
jgi:hypothetical protein